MVPKGRTRLRDPIHANGLVEEIELKSDRTTNSNAYRIVLRLTNSLFEIFKFATIGFNDAGQFLCPYQNDVGRREFDAWTLVDGLKNLRSCGDNAS